MMLLWPLLLVGGAALLAWLMRQGRLGQPDSVTQPEPPLELLRKRYASGEINQEEYDRIRRDLEVS
jgi:putative membrane protein